MSEIFVERLSSQVCNEWDDFVENSNNGTIFHKTKFLSYHPENRFEFCNLKFFNKNSLVALLPGRLHDGDFISPAGASYGGFVTSNIDLALSNQIVLAFKEWCYKNQIRRVKITPSPLPYSKKMNQNIEFNLLYYGFDYTHHLFTSVINLYEFNPDDVLNSFEAHARRNVKKSFRTEGLTVVENKNYEDFYPILIENKKKFNLGPTHTFDEVIKIDKLFPEDVKLFMCYLEEKPIAGLWVFRCNSKTLLAFYISSLAEYQECRPVNRLFYEVIQYGIKNNYKYIDLGVSMNTASDNPMEPSYSLISFKESVSSRGFLRSTLMKVI